MDSETKESGVELGWFSRRRTRLVSLAAFLSLVLVATACGSRLPGTALRQIDAAQAGRASASASAGDQTAAAAGDQSAASSGEQSTAGNTGSSGSSGSSGGGGGSNTATTLAGATAGGCPKGTSTAKGVTPTEIKVGSMSTDSGPLPGATEGEFRGAASYFAMINSQGGICGRKITVLKGDDALDAQHARAEFERLEPQVFAF